MRIKNLHGVKPESSVSLLGGRRRLTIVFCDLVGFTPLSQTMDPEDFGEMILAYQEVGREIYERFGGYVAQFLGDGLLVYFGYPIAHENDAERSVRASMALLDALSELSAQWARKSGTPDSGDQPLLSARIGIHTGLSVVGDSTDSTRSVVFGDAVNIASRLQGVARVNTAVVSGATRQMLPSHIGLTPLGAKPLKGVNAPIEIFEIDMAGRDAPSFKTMSVGNAFVGRQSNLAALTERWAEVCDGKHQALRLSGEAGIGKSALVQRFRDHVRGVPHTWLLADCDSLSTGQAFSPIIRLLRNSIGIRRRVAPDDIFRRLRDALADVEGDRELNVALMAALLGVLDPESDARLPGSAESRREAMLECLIDWMVALTELRPLVLVFEDIHWADASTLEVIRRLALRRRPGRMFVLATERVRESANEKLLEDTMTLIALDDAEARDVINALSASSPLPETVVYQILRRADGNPLYLEELTKAYVRHGTEPAANTSVPGSLEGLLLSSLDVLPEATRRVAHLAAVLGPNLPLPMLAKISGRSVDTDIDFLIDHDILSAQTKVSKRVEFKHALMQEAAQEAVLKRERRDLHRRAADVMIAVMPEFVDQRPDVLAHHFFESRQFEHAAVRFKSAGWSAASSAALQEAVLLYDRGLDALNKATKSRPQLELELQILKGNALMGTAGFGSDDLEPIWKRAATVAEELGDIQELTSALNGLAALEIGRGNLAAGIAYAQRILGLCQAKEDRIGRLRAHSSLGAAFVQQGRLRDALEHSEAAVAHYRPNDFEAVTYGVGTDQGIIAYGSLAMAQWALGLHNEAIQSAQTAVGIAKDIDSILTLAAAKSYLALIHYFRRDEALSYALASETAELCEEAGIPFWHALCLLLKAGQDVDAPAKRIKDLEASMRVAGASNSSSIALGMSIGASCQLANGNADVALMMLDMGIQSDEGGKGLIQPELLRQKAEILLKRGETEIALDLLDKAIALAAEQGGLSLELRSALSRARAMSESRNLEKQHAMVSSIVARFSPDTDSPDYTEATEFLRSGKFSAL